MTRSIVTAVALFVSFLAGGWLLSGVGTRAAEDPKPPSKARGQLYQHWKELGLTKDQVQRIYQIQADYRAKIDELAKLEALRSARSQVVADCGVGAYRRPQHHSAKAKQ